MASQRPTTNQPHQGTAEGTFGFHGTAQGVSQNELLAANLKAAREQAGMSQVALAEAMVERGFPAWRQTTVSRIEMNTRTPQLSELLELMEILPEGDLFGGTAVERLVPVLKRANIGKAIAAKLAKISTELDDLRDLFATYQQTE